MVMSSVLPRREAHRPSISDVRRFSDPGAFTFNARVLLVDDHPVILDALAELVGDAPDLQVCGKATSAAEAIRLATEVSPEVAVVDLSLGDTYGLDLIRDLQKLASPPRVVVYSMHDEMVYAERVVRAGASAYVMKSESAERVIEAIRAVLRGNVFLSRAITSQVLAISGKGEGGFFVDLLTPREKEVFVLLGQGWSSSRIAESLHVKTKTVDMHRRHIKEKLSLHSKNDLLQFAARWVAANTSAVAT